MLRGEAFAGEYEPVTVGLVPLRDLGKVTVSVGDLTGPGGDDPGPRDRRSATSPTASAGSPRKGPSTRSARG